MFTGTVLIMTWQIEEETTASYAVRIADASVDSRSARSKNLLNPFSDRGGADLVD